MAAAPKTTIVGSFVRVPGGREGEATFDRIDKIRHFALEYSGLYFYPEGSSNARAVKYEHMGPDPATFLAGFKIAVMGENARGDLRPPPHVRGGGGTGKTQRRIR